jgi:CDP-2,3-bis-(O-geranylgeranyl)-sn-glycerol synthase
VQLGELLGKAVWILLPGGMANMAPVLAARLFPQLDAPVDLGRSVRGRRIFGAHKTFRGLVAGVMAGAVTLAAQTELGRHLPSLHELSPIWFTGANVIAAGGLLGFGALIGDLVKSFLKRQAGIDPGRAWVPWDQIDWILGTLAAARVFTPLPLSVLVAALVLGLGLHVLVKGLGYLLGINDDWV